ncbi:hypothetical protein YC2023_042119 [Brassica napus]
MSKEKTNLFGITTCFWPRVSFITSCALLQLLVWIKVEQQCEVNSTLDRAIFIVSQVFRPRIGDR